MHSSKPQNSTNMLQKIYKNDLLDEILNENHLSVSS